MSSNPLVLHPHVVHSLYRSLLKEARVLDNHPALKALLPIPTPLQAVIGVSSPMYIPCGPKYMDVIRRKFRDSKQPDLNLAFDTVKRLRAHNSTVGGLVGTIARDHEALIKVLDATAKKENISKRYFIEKEQQKELSTLPETPVDSAGDSAQSDGNEGVALTGEEVVRGSALVSAQPERAPLHVGTMLIAHPLSSAHVDRRVMLVVEKGQKVTTAVVLDMEYTYPLSYGNVMFPEVFWGHEVGNGGYCHVDFTMPPTSNVAILHTLEPPSGPSDPQYKQWQQYVAKRGGAAAAGGRGAAKAAEHHRLFCTVVTKGETRPDGTTLPTLYYSKAEALDYLATIAPGKPRSAVRIFWGVMKWPTAQIELEVSMGHWIPMHASPNFFSAYHFNSGDNSHEDDQHFPTNEELRENRAARMRILGADVTVPQTFPPSQPLCRRQPLWDQILYASGGEYKSLVGMVNPFSRAEVVNWMLPEMVPELLGEGSGGFGDAPPEDDGED